MITYREILDILNVMSEEQLAQPAQVFMSQCDDEPVPLCPVIEFKTVGELIGIHEEGLLPPQRTRGSEDNEHHPEHFVLLADENYFAPDGAIAYDLSTGEAFYGKNKKKVENDSFPKNETGV